MNARQEGLTATYNRFHDPDETSADIEKLRELQIEMDQSVVVEYGWTDLSLNHGFHDTRQGERFTICESARREVIERLLELNHERYEDEVRRGLHHKKAARRKAQRKPKRSSSKDEQPRLIDMEDE